MQFVVRGLLGLALLGGAAYVMGDFSTSDSRNRVLVFGIDGGTWAVIEPMIEAGELPNLARFYNDGVHGEFRSRPPALSPVVWSTIFTGRLPGDHGVKDWKTSHSTHRKVKAIWEMTSDRSLKTYVFNVPSTWPAQEINGVMVSGFPLSGSTVGGNTGGVLTLDALDDRTTAAVYRLNALALRPQAVPLEVGAWSPWVKVKFPARKAAGVMKIKRLDDDSYYFSPFYRIDDELVVTYPSDLRKTQPERMGEFYIPEGPGWSLHAEADTPEYLYDHLVDVSRVQTATARGFVGDDWDLFIYVNTLVDRVSHPYWAYFQPQAFPEMDARKAAKYSEAVRNAYRETDRQLGQVLEAVGSEDFYFVVLSDHGFGASNNAKSMIGTHRFEGIYLFAGPGILGSEGPRINIEDATPAILYLLGLESAQDIAGKLPESLLSVHGPAREPIASYETLAKPGSDLPVDAATWEQLRGLGYVDGAPRRKD